MTLIQLAALFQEQKLWFVTTSELSKDALHIYFGLALFLVVRFAWRWRGGWFVAWLAVLAMALGGEWLDIVNETRNSALQPDAAHWHDIRNTIFWPTVLALVGRWFPRGERIAAAAETPQRSGDHAERGLEQT